MLLSGPAGADDRTGVWGVSVLTGTLRKLRDDVLTAAPSPDGSRIAFVTSEGREIWTMEADGEEAQQVLTAGTKNLFAQVAWSADGTRLVYLRRGERSDAIESSALDGGRGSVLLEDQGLGSFFVSVDGRILYQMAEPEPNHIHSNLWEARIGPAAEELVGRPRRVTSLVGFDVQSPSVSTDGRRVAFVRGYHQGDVYVGDLVDGGQRLADPRRLTLDDRIDWPGGWTPDGGAVYFFSDRSGGFDLYRQRLDQSRPELMVSGPDEQREPRPSPDGRWILYLAWESDRSEDRPGRGRLMRFSLAGGPAEQVLEVVDHPGPLLAQAQYRREMELRSHPSFRCARRATSKCVLTELQGEELTFTAFDPLEGRGERLLTVDTGGVHTFWDLAPDGGRIAVGRFESDRGAVQVMELPGGATRDVVVNGWARLDSVAWSADGEALYVTSWSSKGSTMLRVGLDGSARVLHQVSDWIDRPTPSPDGRRLAFAKTATDSNAWLIER